MSSYDKLYDGVALPAKDEVAAAIAAVRSRGLAKSLPLGSPGNAGASGLASPFSVGNTKTPTASQTPTLFQQSTPKLQTISFGSDSESTSSLVKQPAVLSPSMAQLRARRIISESRGKHSGTLTNNAASTPRTPGLALTVPVPTTPCSPYDDDSDASTDLSSLVNVDPATMAQVSDFIDLLQKKNAGSPTDEGGTGTPNSNKNNSSGVGVGTPGGSLAPSGASEVATPRGLSPKSPRYPPTPSAVASSGAKIFSPGAMEATSPGVMSHRAASPVSMLGASPAASRYATLTNAKNVLANSKKLSVVTDFNNIAKSPVGSAVNKSPVSSAVNESTPRRGNITVGLVGASKEWKGSTTNDATNEEPKVNMGSSNMPYLPSDDLSETNSDDSVFSDIESATSEVAKSTRRDVEKFIDSLHEKNKSDGAKQQGADLNDKTTLGAYKSGLEMSAVNPETEDELNTFIQSMNTMEQQRSLVNGGMTPIVSVGTNIEVSFFVDGYDAKEMYAASEEECDKVFDAELASNNISRKAQDLKSHTKKLPRDTVALPPDGEIRNQEMSFDHAAPTIADELNAMNAHNGEVLVCVDGADKMNNISAKEIAEEDPIFSSPEKSAVRVAAGVMKSDGVHEDKLQFCSDGKEQNVDAAKSISTIADELNAKVAEEIDDQSAIPHPRHSPAVLEGAMPPTVTEDTSEAQQRTPTARDRFRSKIASCPSSHVSKTKTPSPGLSVGKSKAPASHLFRATPSSPKTKAKVEPSPSYRDENSKQQSKEDSLKYISAQITEVVRSEVPSMTLGKVLAEANRRGITLDVVTEIYKQERFKVSLEKIDRWEAAAADASKLGECGSVSSNEVQSPMAKVTAAVRSPSSQIAKDIASDALQEFPSVVRKTVPLKQAFADDMVVIPVEEDVKPAATSKSEAEGGSGPVTATLNTSQEIPNLGDAANDAANEKVVQFYPAEAEIECHANKETIDAKEQSALSEETKVPEILSTEMEKQQIEKHVSLSPRGKSPQLISDKSTEATPSQHKKEGTSKILENVIANIKSAVRSDNPSEEFGKILAEAKKNRIPINPLVEFYTKERMALSSSSKNQGPPKDIVVSRVSEDGIALAPTEQVVHGYDPAGERGLSNTQLLQLQHLMNASGESNDSIVHPDHSYDSTESPTTEQHQLEDIDAFFSRFAIDVGDKQKDSTKKRPAGKKMKQEKAPHSVNTRQTRFESDPSNKIKDDNFSDIEPQDSSLFSERGNVAEIRAHDNGKSTVLYMQESSLEIEFVEQNESLATSKTTKAKKKKHKEKKKIIKIRPRDNRKVVVLKDDLPGQLGYWRSPWERNRTRSHYYSNDSSNKKDVIDSVAAAAQFAARKSGSMRRRLCFLSEKERTKGHKGYRDIHFYSLYEGKRAWQIIGQLF
jgi:hypothetical protein